MKTKKTNKTTTKKHEKDSIILVYVIGLIAILGGLLVSWVVPLAVFWALNTLFAIDILLNFSTLVAFWMLAGFLYAIFNSK
jgi:uncharacterized membrane protein HdeD (DUF308 family)